MTPKSLINHCCIDQGPRISRNPPHLCFFFRCCSSWCSFGFKKPFSGVQHKHHGSCDGVRNKWGFRVRGGDGQQKYHYHFGELAVCHNNWRRLGNYFVNLVKQIRALRRFLKQVHLITSSLACTLVSRPITTIRKRGKSRSLLLIN